ncbi:MAG TPA: PilZ domain-containing protein [Myxococcota bacterium]|nr:PilZ domain-containing protein [Myxococcota bacterium]
MPVSDYGALLVLDSQKCSLGQAALALVRLGVEALYANDIDEASLLARQEGTRVRGVLAPSSIGAGEAAEILDAVAPHTSVLPASLVLAGPRPDDEAIAALRAGGLRWALWEPYEPPDLRFLATLAVWEGSDSELRLEPRVPTALRASVTVGGKTRPVRVLDLTTTGAFLECDGPPAPGRNVGLEIALPSGSIQIVAYVRWVRAVAQKKPIELPAGCGVEFAPPQPAEAEALRQQMLAGMARFQLR